MIRLKPFLYVMEGKVPDRIILQAFTDFCFLLVHLGRSVCGPIANWRFIHHLSRRNGSSPMIKKQNIWEDFVLVNTRYKFHLNTTWLPRDWEQWGEALLSFLIDISSHIRSSSTTRQYLLYIIFHGKMMTFAFLQDPVQRNAHNFFRNIEFDSTTTSLVPDSDGWPRVTLTY